MGLTNEFQRSMVFETGEFERPKSDCIYADALNPSQQFFSPVGTISYFLD